MTHSNVGQLGEAACLSPTSESSTTLRAQKGWGTDSQVPACEAHPLWRRSPLPAQGLARSTRIGRKGLRPSNWSGHFSERPPPWRLDASTRLHRRYRAAARCDANECPTKFDGTHCPRRIRPGLVLSRQPSVERRERFGQTLRSELHVSLRALALPSRSPPNPSGPRPYRSLCSSTFKTSARPVSASEYG